MPIYAMKHEPDYERRQITATFDKMVADANAEREAAVELAWMWKRAQLSHLRKMTGG